jgi:16S rRNA (adenine1518-N6/adenine1519-N6)-dimethyltransferase
MKRNLGQNFLIDKNIAEREVNHAKISKKDVVLEVGPGKGILTFLLAEKAKEVISIEIDEKIVKNLRNRLPENVTLIHKDALKVDFDALPKFNKIVSNLPFQISSPITFKLLDYDFNLAILVYQKEFAKRMIATPGSKDYSRLSVNVYYKAKCELLEKIPKTCFKPPPKVDSCSIKLFRKKTPPFFVVNKDFFTDLTRILFNYRRKKIKKILNDFYGMEKKEIPFLNNRVEELTPEQIGNLSNILYKIISKN